MLTTLYRILFALVCIITAVHFSGGLMNEPLFGRGDSALWEAVGHYFSHNVRFLPYPHIDFTTNAFFYPYGGSIVFLGWGVERDLFYTLYNSVLGQQNGLLVYRFLSLLVTSFGTFFIFRKDFGELKSMLAGFVVTFFNFYSIAKMPGHFNMAIVHWTTLSICLDHLILYRLAGKEPLSLRLLLTRALVLILSVGQTLGYVAGYALLSFCVMSVWAIGLVIWANSVEKKTYTIENVLKGFKTDYETNKRTCIGIAALTAIAGYLYVSLDLSIVQQVKQFEVPFNGGAMWSSPWRVLVPWLPWFNPSNISVHWLEIFLPENSEGLGANSPGYFLLATAFLGTIYSKRKTAAAFCLFILVVALTNHPYQLLSITHLPWLEFARVGSRISILFAPVLGVLLLSIPFEEILTNKKMQVYAPALLCLALVEFWTFTQVHDYRPIPLSRAFYSYMDIVKNTKGEAVLDWPFCIAGGNGVGSNELGVFYGRNNYIAYMQRYHDKSVVGLYAGRMTEEHIAPFMRAGFQKILSPDSPNIMKAQRQNRPMTEEEWAFIDDFFTLNDFAGINLYTELIHPADKKRFFQTFGKAKSVLTLPGVGNVSFIPKDAIRRTKISKQAGRELVFLPPLRKVASMANKSSELTLLGFKTVSSPTGPLQAASNASRILFRAAESMPVNLFINGATDPEIPVQLRLGGQTINIQGSFSGKAMLQAKQGINELEVLAPHPGFVLGFKEVQIAPSQKP